MFSNSVLIITTVNQTFTLSLEALLLREFTALKEIHNSTFKFGKRNRRSLLKNNNIKKATKTSLVSTEIYFPCSDFCELRNEVHKM